MLNCQHKEIAHYDIAGGDHALCRQCGKMLSINGIGVDELIARQMDGEELLLTPEMEVEDENFARVGGYEVTATTTGLVISRIEDEQLMSAEFLMYVDGYILRPNDECTIEGQAGILCTAPDGRTCVMKTSVLTAFIERRINE